MNNSGRFNACLPEFFLPVMDAESFKYVSISVKVNHRSLSLFRQKGDNVTEVIRQPCPPEYPNRVRTC